MELNVEHVDAAGKVNCTKFRITLPAFLKHFSMVARGRRTLLASIPRMVSSAILYADYIPCCRSFHKALGFNEPPTERYDLHEKGTFSGLVGKAIADYLAKRIDKAIYSVPYESEMVKRGFQIIGQRPDLLCIVSDHNRIAVEAKGYCSSTVPEKEMKKHKAQSSSGPISVNRSVASVSFNIYEKACVKYHDPNSEDKDNEEDTIAITKEFYTDVASLLRFDNGIRVVFEDEKEKEFAAILVQFLLFRSSLSARFLRLFIGCPLYRVFVLLDDEKVINAARTGELPLIEYRMEDNYYVDSDGIGLFFLNPRECEVSDKKIYVYKS